MDTAFTVNPASKRAVLALPLIILATMGLLYFGAIAPDVLPTWLPFTLVNNSFVDSKLKYQIATFVLALPP